MAHWFIVWSYVIASSTGVEHKSIPFGPYRTEEGCTRAAIMAPIEPALQVIEPRIAEAQQESFVCVYIEDPETIMQER